MPSDKDRLYVALYLRGGAPKMPGLEDTYHWALITGPKDDKGPVGLRYHAKEKIEAQAIQWRYEELSIPLVATQALLVRVCIGKIEKLSRVQSILRSVPVRGGVPNWNCVIWVKDALEMLSQDRASMGTSQLDWETVKAAAMQYVQRKKDQRRWDSSGSFDISQPPTFDLLQNKEIIQ